MYINELLFYHFRQRIDINNVVTDAIWVKLLQISQIRQFVILNSLKLLALVFNRGYFPGEQNQRGVSANPLLFFPLCCNRFLMSRAFNVFNAGA